MFKQEYISLKSIENGKKEMKENVFFCVPCITNTFLIKKVKQVSFDLEQNEYYEEPYEIYYEDEHPNLLQTIKKIML